MYIEARTGKDWHNFGRNLMVANKPSLIGILCSVVTVVGVVRGHDLADR